MEADRRAVIARIIRQVGSAPRTIGTKCIFFEDGSLQGTIGGGALEFQAMTAAKNVIAEDRSAILNFQLTGKEVAQTDMLCGGKVDVFLEPVAPGNAAAGEVFSAAAQAVARGQKGLLLTLVAEGIESNDASCRAFVASDGSVVGKLAGISAADEKRLQTAEDITPPMLVELGDRGLQVFAETVEPDNVLYIFGAGHISTFIAPLAKMVGFKVVVLDDRNEFANRERFAGADEIMALPFADAFRQITVTATSYIAIVTRGHIFDHEVLRFALKQPAAYVGMIGSKRKRDIVYRALREEGFSEKDLEAVHSPIGLEIGAETPEEIAICIVAELIKERADRRGDFNSS